jgi:CHAT domain-containing protein/tetratricopeptide (TPR) repeat protein
LSGVERIHALGQEGRDAEALPLARELLSEVGDGAALPATLPLARALNQLGQFFYHREYSSEAVAAYTPALHAVERCAPEDRASIATIRNNLGQARERLGDLASAREHLEASLAIRQALPDTPLDIAITQDNLASVLTRLGDTERAEALIHQALETFEAVHGPAHHDVATALNNLGSLYAGDGDVARARATYLRALDAHLQSGGLDGAGTLITAANLAAFCLTHHDQTLAYELADLLLAIGGDQPDARHHGTATAVLTLAGHAFNAFSLGLAERLARRACELLRVTEGPSAPRTRAAMSLLANVYGAKGNQSEAERLQMQVLDMPDQTPLERAQRLLDFGKSLRARGRGSFAAAGEMFEHALRLLHEHPDPEGLASALGNLAQLRFDNDEPEAAEALYLEALAAIGEEETRHELPWLLHNLAMVRYHLARHDEALAGYERAGRLWATRLGDRHPFVATTDANVALVHWADGKTEAAARAFASAHRLRAPELVRQLSVGSERERLAAAREQLDNLYKVVSFHVATGAAGSLAATMLLQHKGGVLDAMVQSHARLRRRLDPHSRVLLDRLAQVQRQIADAVASETLLGGHADPRTVATLQGESERLQTEIGHRSAFGQAQFELPTLEAVRAVLPPGSTLLEFLRYPVFNPVRTGRHRTWDGARYAALVLRRDGGPEWVDLGDAATIDAAVEHARHRLADPDTPGVESALRALSTLVIAPLESRLAHTERLSIAPDGALNLAPFGVLGEPRLLERCDIGLLMGGRELLRGDTEPSLSPPQAIVDPEYGDGERGVEPRFERLPGTRDEAQALRALWPDLHVFEGARATAEALRGMARPALLHIGTHGHFEEPASDARHWDTDILFVDGRFYFVQRAGPSARADAMLHGGLAFAGANRSVPGRPVGIISAAELAGLDLRGTALAVLSACETGLGTAAQGEEFAGLRRAFAIAGSQTQVTSLWWVDDAAASTFMRAFYRRLRDGAGRAEALRDAQREVRAHPEWAHPAYWASFVIWGDAGPLPAALFASGGHA